MNEDRRKNNSIKMTARWERAEKYATILGCHKEITFKYLGICNKYEPDLSLGKPWIIDKVKKEIENEVNKSKQSIERVKHIEPFNPKKKYGNNDPINEPLDALKLMLWTINKIGDIKKAQKIFNAAKLALEALE